MISSTNGSNKSLRSGGARLRGNGNQVTEPENKATRKWKGKLVELQTEDLLVRGLVVFVNEKETVFHLVDGIEVTLQQKLAEVAIVTEIVAKRIIRDPIVKALNNGPKIAASTSSCEHPVSSETSDRNKEAKPEKHTSEHEDCNGEDETSRAETVSTKQLVVPEDVWLQKTELFKGLKGKRLKPDGMPAHLKEMKDSVPFPGLAKTSMDSTNVKKPESEPIVESCEDLEWEAICASLDTVCGIRGKCPEPQRLAAQKVLEPVTLQQEPSVGSNMDSGVFFVDNHFNLVKAVEMLSGVDKFSLAVQGDFRELPGDISLICFAVPERAIIVDFVACGKCYGKVRDCFKEILENKNVLKICMECGIVAEVLRSHFGIELTNVFDPQVADGFLAAGEDKSKMVPGFYCTLMVLVGLYVPHLHKTLPTYCQETVADVRAWLIRPVRRQCLQIAAAEVNVLLPLHKAMTERLMAKVNRITSCRLTQFKGRTGNVCKLQTPKVNDMKLLTDDRERMERSNRSLVEIAMARTNRMPVSYSKNIAHEGSSPDEVRLYRPGRQFSSSSSASQFDRNGARNESYSKSSIHGL